MQTNKKAEQRRRKITEYVSAKGAAKLSELCAYFNSSEATIRNDLTALEKQGLLQRVLGGAISNIDTIRNPVLSQRMNKNNEEKKQIARYVAEHFLKPDMTISLDSGTTGMELAREIVARKIPCTIVTNSFHAAYLLSKSSEVTICLCGGTYDHDHGSFHDEIAERTLDSYFCEICFLCPNGIDENGLVTNSGTTEQAIKSKMLRQAKKVIVLADHSKLMKTELKVLCNSRDVDCLITDSKVSAEAADKLRGCGFRLEIAE